MKHLILAPVVALALTGPAAAQDAEEDGPSLMERGAQLFFEGLMQEMEPALKDLGRLAEEFGPAFQEFAEEMGPALGAILDRVEDWSVYEPPEILPNGDIIIRRKPDAPELPPLGEGEDIEL